MSRPPRDPGPARRSRIRRVLAAVPIVALLIVGLLALVTHRYQLTLGGGPYGGLSVRAARDPFTPPMTARLAVPFPRVSLHAARGRLVATRWRPDDPRPPTIAREWPGVAINRSGYGGDDVIRDGRPFFGTATNVAIDYGLLALVPAAIVAGQWFALVRRRRRTLPGHCPRCGYDLRATPDRCPECGRSATFTTDPQATRPSA